MFRRRECGLSGITVEPLLFLSDFAHSLARPTENALLFQRLYVDSYNETLSVHHVHAGNSTRMSQLTYVDQETSRWKFYLVIASLLPSTLLGLVFGSISDRYGRRLPMVISSVGHILSLVPNLLVALVPSCPTWLLIMGSLAYGLLGGKLTYYACCYSYLSDVTTPEDKTCRFSFLTAASRCGMIVAFFLSGILLQQVGFVVIYSGLIGIILLTIVYVLVFLKDKPRPPPGLDYQNNEQKYTIETAKTFKHVGKSNGTTRIRGVEAQEHDTSSHQGVEYKGSERRISRLLTDTFEVLWKPRPSSANRRLAVQMSLIFLYGVSNCSVSSIGYVFLIHPPLSFNQTQYGYFRGVHEACSAVALLLAIPLFTKRLRLSDTGLLLLGLISCMLGEVILGFSATPSLVYVGAASNLFSQAPYVAVRGLLVGTVPREEQGRVLSIMVAAECLSTVTSSAVFGFLLFPATVNFYPGLSFLAASGLILAPLSLAVWLHVDIKKHNLAAFLDYEALP